MKGAGLQRVQFPPGNWFAPPGSNRGGSGGNKAVGALGVKGRMATPWRNISIALEGQPGRKDNKAHTSVWRAGSRGSGLSFALPGWRLAWRHLPMRCGDDPLGDGPSGFNTYAGSSTHGLDSSEWGPIQVGGKTWSGVNFPLTGRQPHEDPPSFSVCYWQFCCPQTRKSVGAQDSTQRPGADRN